MPGAKAKPGFAPLELCKMSYVCMWYPDFTIIMTLFLFDFLDHVSPGTKEYFWIGLWDRNSKGKYSWQDEITEVSIKLRNMKVHTRIVKELTSSFPRMKSIIFYNTP